MTAKKDLKRRVRERQAQTGESYVTARQHVLAKAEQSSERTSEPIPVVEMISLTDRAKPLGYRCSVRIASTLAARVDSQLVLEQVIAALSATIGDPQFENLRQLVLHGVMPPAIRRHGNWVDEHQRFLARARSGIGGISANGNLMALAVDGLRGTVMVLVHVGYKPPHGFVNPMRAIPRIILSDVEDMISPAGMVIY